MKFSPKQNEFIRNANHRYNFKIGAVRSGKSFVDIAYTVPSRLRELKDKQGLNVILGVSKETIERNVLQPMREIYTDYVVSTINSRNIAYVCGVPVYCLGAEKASQVAKIQGSSIKYCYGDEIAKWNVSVWEMLKSRLDKPYSIFDGACNPEYPSHWLKDFLDREDIDKYVQKYTLFDNPFLSKEFVENLCKEYQGTVYYKRYVLGEWALAEGLIYPMYADAIEEVPKTPVKAYCLSIDYGTRNAFAALLWELHDTTWYASRGYYYSGRDMGVNKTDDEYLTDLDNLIEDIGGTIEVIIDPSAASFITLLKKHGHRYKVHEADNDVMDGIRETAVAMQRNLIKVSPNIKEWKKEVEGYVWDDDSLEDRPIKVNDHCLTGDTIVMTESGKKRIDEMVGTSGNVWSYNTKTGKAELKPFTDCRMTQKQAEIYEIETIDGRTIKCTCEHPILTKRGYIQAQYLEITDEIIDIMDSMRYNIDNKGGLNYDDTVFRERRSCDI